MNFFSKFLYVIFYLPAKIHKGVEFFRSTPNSMHVVMGVFGLASFVVLYKQINPYGSWWILFFICWIGILSTLGVLLCLTLLFLAGILSFITAFAEWYVEEYEVESKTEAYKASTTPSKSYEPNKSKETLYDSFDESRLSTFLEADRAENYSNATFF